MSSPRFLADHDLKEGIIDGVLRREPSIEFFRARRLGLHNIPDVEVLAFAAENGLLVVSHDVNTMPATFYRRQLNRLAVPGLIMAQQSTPIGLVIDQLLLIWSSSEAEEWFGLVTFLPL